MHFWVRNLSAELLFFVTHDNTGTGQLRRLAAAWRIVMGSVVFDDFTYFTEVVESDNWLV